MSSPTQPHIRGALYVQGWVRQGKFGLGFGPRNLLPAETAVRAQVGQVRRTLSKHGALPSSGVGAGQRCDLHVALAYQRQLAVRG
eukprot:2197635-Pyramimonas_sp.AAC.1